MGNTWGEKYEKIILITFTPIHKRSPLKTPETQTHMGRTIRETLRYSEHIESWNWQRRLNKCTKTYQAETVLTHHNET